MSFLSPFALALAAAAIVPLVLHLRRRRVARTVEFPAARYLARATRDHERTLRARSSLLAALRILLVLLLALAAARPFGRIGTGHGRASVAILLDNSLSMSAVAGGRSVLDAARDGARAVLDAASPEDRLFLVTADGATTSGDRAELRDALAAVHPLAGAGDLGGALRSATALARSVRDATPAVVVLTDAQASSWRAVSGAAAALWTPAAPPPANRAVTAAAPRPSRWNGRGTIHVVVGGATAGDTIPLRVDADGRAIARGVAASDGAGSTEGDVAITSPPAGWSAARVVLPPDELPADDERWVALWNGSAPRVASRAGPFADQAVEALAAAGVVERGADVLVVSADALGALPALIAAPTDPSRVGAANRALERAGVPWRFGAERRETARVRGAGIAGVDARQRFALVAAGAAPAETLATVGVEPWIVAGDRYVLVGSALDTAATTFPAAAGFVPWLGRVITERLAGSGGADAAAVPGARVAVPARVDSVELPGGGRLQVRDTLALPQRAGVYFWVRGGARAGALVVNGEAEESDLRRLDDGAMARRLGMRGGAAHDAGRLADAAYGGASRRPLGAAVLGLALLTLLAEAAVAGRLGALLPRRAAGRG